MPSAVRLFGLLAEDRLRALGLLALMLLGAIFEALGIAAIFPFIAITTDQHAVFRYRVLHQLYRLSGLNSTRAFLIWIGVALIVVYLLKAAYLIFLTHLQHSFFMRRRMSISRQLLTGYLACPYSFHLQRNSADMQRVLNSDLQHVFNGVVPPVFRMIIECMVVVAIATVLLIIEPIPAIMAIVMIGVTGVFFSRVSRKQVTVSGTAQTARFGEMIRWVNQALGSVKETKVLGRERFFVDEYSRASVDFARAARTYGVASELPRLTIELLIVIAVLGTVVAMLLSVSDLQQAIPTIGLFAMAAVRLMPSLNRIAAGTAALRFFHASIEAVDRDIREVEASAAEPSPESDSNGDVLSPQTMQLGFKNSIEVRGVSYRYPGAARPALKDVSLVIPKGHAVAFAGSSGAGKTTLVDLILGILTPDTGEVLVDGQNIQHNLRAWQSIIGYIPQSTYLLDDTIRRNVAFGIPEAQIDDRRVERALNIAQLSQLIDGLREKLNSYVGEHGVRLSGGQRQRLGVARAVYSAPEVLVLDEATSAVDRQTERDMLQAIASLGREMTTIAVSHRVYTLRACDAIFLMKDGQIIGAGLYDALFSAHEEFREMARSTTPLPGGDTPEARTVAE